MEQKRFKGNSPIGPDREQEKESDNEKWPEKRDSLVLSDNSLGISPRPL
jgi:hypothetical protein